MKSKTISVLTIIVSLLLFNSYSFGEDSASDRSKQQGVSTERRAPIAVLPERGYKFEPVPDGIEVRHDFVLQNKGSSPLKINSVKTG